MEPREYFEAVATELQGIKTPQSLRDMEDGEAIKTVVDFVWNLWERNIAPEMAAQFVVQKFGVWKEERPN